MTLQDIAQIYVEDVFCYDLLLLSVSGGLPDFPKDNVANNIGYWSAYKRGDVDKKFYCQNFGNESKPGDIIHKFLESAAVDNPTEGK